ncbi:MAG: ATP-binding protein [Lachnospiraceae bacterium]|nr:ATP-binding protein [Lachnospiraceae bacterium]
MTLKRVAYYGSLFVLVAVVTLSYFICSISTDFGMALIAHEFTYMDGTFIMMLFLFCVMDLSGYSVPKQMSIPMCVVNTLILLTDVTSPLHNLFIKNPVLRSDYGASHLDIEYGPVYNVFIVQTVMYIIGVFLVLNNAFQRRKARVSYKQTFAIGWILALIIVIYIIQTAAHIPFDMLPIGYVMIMLVILYIIQRNDVYDVAVIAVESNEQNKDFGCIVFNRRKNYLGSNESARFYFPDLEHLTIDAPVPPGNIRKEFVDWIDHYEAGNTSKKIFNIFGKKITCSIRAYLKDKRKVGYIIVMRDDTEQQDLIEKLNSMNEELALTVAALDQASKTKSQFLANMSHEIRTPINAILGMNEIAMRECDDSAQMAHLQDIESAGNNLLSIINDILDFSKIEAGKIDFFNEDYKVAFLIKDVVDLIEKKANDKGLKLNIDIDESIPEELCGDKNRILQAFVNVLNNAVKYTAEGSVTFKLSGEKKNDTTIILTAEISDTGIGIKEEDLVELFQSFSRIEEKRNRSIEGTGLGLAITQRLIEGMDGTIHVSSVYGEGSVFTMTIPQEIKSTEPLGDYKLRVTGEKKHKKVECNVDATGVQILVVDDNSMNLKVSKGLLKPTNATVTLAGGGREALDLMAKQHFDIIFLDHMMPEMDGLETLSIAKKTDHMCKNSKYIALTANAISGVREQFMEAGFDEFLSKPVKPQDLYHTVEQYMPKSNINNS